MNDNRQILTEYIGTLHINKESMNEATTNKNGDIFLEGKIQAADTKNRNGRIYPKHILEREYKKILEKIKNNKGGGELDHPNSSIVNLKNISHKMTEL